MDKTYSTMLLHFAIPVDMQHDHVLLKLNFDLWGGGGGGGGGRLRENVCYHIAAFGDSLLFYMQYDHVLKKWDSGLLTPFPGSGGGGGGGGGICRQNICYLVAAFIT